MEMEDLGWGEATAKGSWKLKSWQQKINTCAVQRANH